MIIKSINLTNFRSHDHYRLDCTNETSLVLGPNGSGKTSVLEAIYILTQGKSFRASDPEIIKRGTDFYRIELEFISGETITATYNHHQKTFLTADHKSRRLPKKYRYPVVLFEPSDLNLISHAPSRRRTYFDRIFSQFDPNFPSHLSRYEKALRQRNELLKSEHLSRDCLFSWDILLARHGTEICRQRTIFLNEISSRLTEVYHSIATSPDQLSLNYRTEVSGYNESDYLLHLEQNFTKDHYLGHTTFGVHHDDYLFEFNHQPADGSASRGESRTFILALKFIESDLIYQKTGSRPLILLDDVFSELDSSRRHSLVQNFQNHQIILTSVEEIQL